jgi:hypothetical protein
MNVVTTASLCHDFVRQMTTRGKEGVRWAAAGSNRFRTLLVCSIRPLPPETGRSVVIHYNNTIYLLWW